MAAMQTIPLPAEIRKCLKCASGRMLAEQAGRGGGWGGGWIQYLFVCDSCGHRMVLEGARSRAMMGIASTVLIPAAIAIGVFAPAPAGFVVGAPIVALALFAAYRDLVEPVRHFPVIGQREDGPPEVELQDALFVSENERDRARWRQRIVEWGVYSIVAATVLFFAYSFLVGGW